MHHPQALHVLSPKLFAKSLHLKASSRLNPFQFLSLWRVDMLVDGGIASPSGTPTSRYFHNMQIGLLPLNGNAVASRSIPQGMSAGRMRRKRPLALISLFRHSTSNEDCSALRAAEVKSIIQREPRRSSAAGFKNKCCAQKSKMHCLTSSRVCSDSETSPCRRTQVTCVRLLWPERRQAWWYSPNQFKS